MMYDPQTSSTAPPHLWSGAKRGAKHTARIKPNQVCQKKKNKHGKREENRVVVGFSARKSQRSRGKEDRERQTGEGGTVGLDGVGSARFFALLLSFCSLWSQLCSYAVSRFSRPWLPSAPSLLGVRGQSRRANEVRRERNGKEKQATSEEWKEKKLQ